MHRKLDRAKGWNSWGTQIHALERKLTERERENSYRGRPPNPLNISPWWVYIFLLAPLPFYLCLRGRALTPSTLAPCVYMQQTRKQANKQAKKWIEGKHAKWQARKRCQMGANKHVTRTNKQTNKLSNKKGCPWRTNVGLDQMSRVPLDWRMDDTQTHAWTCRQVCKEKA